MTVGFWIFAAIALTAVLIAAFQTKRPLQALCGSAVQGVCALAAVNVAAMWSGTSLGVTVFSLTTASLLGIPGVIGLVLMQTLCLLPL